MMKFRLPITIMIILCIVNCSHNEKEAVAENPENEQVQSYDGMPSLTDPSDWKVDNAVKPGDSMVLKIELKEKYGIWHELYCMAIFSNEKTKQYKLVAPWYEDIIITWSQTTSKKATLVPLDSVPEDLRVKPIFKQ